MQIVKVGLLGAGWFGRKHLNAWQHINNSEVVAIADKNIDNINEDNFNSSQSGFHASDSDEIFFKGKKYKVLEELINNENIDVIDIVTPPETHFSLAMECIEAGKHVIIEKPFTLNYNDASLIFQKAMEKKVKVFASHILRFDSRVQKIKNLVDQGEIGRLLYGSFKRNFQPTAHAIYGTIHPLYSALIHDIDLLLWLSGSEVKTSIGLQKHFFHKQNPDVLSIILEMENETVFHLENLWHIANVCPSGFENSISLYGEKGNCFQKDEPVIELWSNNKVQYPDMFFWPNINYQVGGALKNMLSHYADCIINDRHSTILPPEEILKTIRTIEFIEKQLMQKNNEQK